MQVPTFEEGVDSIVCQDPRYPRDAYLFVRDALDHTQKSVERTISSAEPHVTGQELLEGIRAYALKQFGPMAMALLAEWGIQRGEDFGEIVFKLIDHGILRKTDSDSRADFSGGYDFFEAFRRPFLPTRSVFAGPEAVSEPRSKAVLP